MEVIACYARKTSWQTLGFDMKRETICIFYSWQSDTNEKANKYLIRDALKKAIKKLKKSLNIVEDIILDHDTLNVPGIPQITDEILKKIDRCSIFIPDITYIAKTKNDKYIPNPNVAIELGYALNTLGSERIITVLNEAYGTCSDGLPFDIVTRRWPVSYCLTPDFEQADLKKVENKLADDLFAALNLIIKKGFVNSTKIDGYVRKIISEIKEDIFFTKYSPIPKIEALEKNFSELENYAVNGELLDVETFLEFIKTKYFPIITEYLNSKDGKGKNYLEYWDNIFGKNGCLKNIEKSNNKIQIADMLTLFKSEMSFSKYVPVQSKEQYENKFKVLSKKAISGDLEDIENLKNYIKEYLEFLKIYTGGGVNNKYYLSKWNEVNDALSSIEQKYQYI